MLELNKVNQDLQWRMKLLKLVLILYLQDARVYSEEVELDGRDPEQDYVQYKESCESLATLMGEIQDLKANGAKDGVSFILIYKSNIFSVLMSMIQRGYYFVLSTAKKINSRCLFTVR